MGAIHFSLDERLVEFFIRHLKTSVFVETGTFRGDTLAMARGHFSQCHSIELSDELYQAATERFKNDGVVHLYHGNSPGILAEIIGGLRDKPVFFWLDAHWCSADHTAGQSSQSPLIDELRAIGKLHPDSVILIDDARLYLSTPPAPHAVADWPDIHDLALEFLALGDHHRMSIFDDIIAFYPARLKEELGAHIHQHAVDWQKIAGDAKKQQKRQSSGIRGILRKK
jgi:hypothetical protein